VVAASQFPEQFRADGEESRVVLYDVPWATYVVLRDTVDSSGIRMTYLRGALEIMSPSRRHEVSKTQIARLLELFCLERGIALYGYGSTTFRNEPRAHGLEPDECYCRDADREVPDVAIEVVVTAAALDKLEIYRALGVREVWTFQADRFQVLALANDTYEAIDTSAIFPELDLDRLAHWTTQPDQAAALVGWRDELRR
jgi:Uma2 family endonuclease